MPMDLQSDYVCRAQVSVPASADVAARAIEWRQLGNSSAFPAAVARWSLGRRPHQSELCKIYVYIDGSTKKTMIKAVYGDEIRDCSKDFIGPVNDCN